MPRSDDFCIRTSGIRNAADGFFTFLIHGYCQLEKGARAEIFTCMLLFCRP